MESGDVTWDFFSSRASEDIFFFFLWKACWKVHCEWLKNKEIQSKLVRERFVAHTKKKKKQMKLSHRQDDCLCFPCPLNKICFSAVWNQCTVPFAQAERAANFFVVLLNDSFGFWQVLYAGVVVIVLCRISKCFSNWCQKSHLRKKSFQWTCIATPINHHIIFDMLATKRAFLLK